MISREFRVEGMHCSACVMRIEDIEDELPGITSVVASYKKGRVKVTFDEQLVSSDQILAAVNQKGYRSSLLE